MVRDIKTAFKKMIIGQRTHLEQCLPQKLYDYYRHRCLGTGGLQFEPIFRVVPRKDTSEPVFLFKLFGRASTARDIGLTCRRVQRKSIQSCRGLVRMIRRDNPKSLMYDNWSWLRIDKPLGRLSGLLSGPTSSGRNVYRKLRISAIG